MLDVKADRTGPEKTKGKVWQTYGIMPLKARKGIVMPKKFLLAAAMVLVLVFMAGCGGGGATDGASSDPVKEVVNIEPEKELTGAEKIEKVIRDRIADGEYRKVEIDRIAINENMAADDGTYIALVYLDFNVMNTVKTGNGMMRMYSDDIVAHLGTVGVDNVGEAAVFWKDEYNNRSLKYAYEYRNGNFYLTSKME